MIINISIPLINIVEARCRLEKCFEQRKCLKNVSHARFGIIFRLQRFPMPLIGINYLQSKLSEISPRQQPVIMIILLQAEVSKLKTAREPVRQSNELSSLLPIKGYQLRVICSAKPCIMIESNIVDKKVVQQQTSKKVV